VRTLSVVTAVIALFSVPPSLNAQQPHPTEQKEFKPIQSPAWVYGVTRMAFCTPDEIEPALKAGAEVIHFNLVWPYYPLHKDGGGLSPEDTKKLHDFVDRCHKGGAKAVLGLPPFMSVSLAKTHPDWRIHNDDSGAILKVTPEEGRLDTRNGCSIGPWGTYLNETCAELVKDFGLDGFSFDGNYHPPLCFCPACKADYRQDTGKAIPSKIDLDSIEYRQYLVWRGERLEAHYRDLQERIKAINPNAVLISWTVNAGRYGHFLTSPRAMSTRMNLLLDMPMQEWWQDETNLGPTVAPAFGAAYLRAVTGDRPNASEPYMMSHGNPYGTDSFPAHEQITRVLMAVTQGSILAEALGWPGHRGTALEAFNQISARSPWITNTNRMPWAAMVVSEQTRQFYAYKDVAGIYLPHLYGMFRVALEEHLPVNLINDWDLNSKELSRYRALVLPNMAAMSDAQAEAIRKYVQDGGGVVATCETSLFDELGRRRKDFALADLFGVSYLGRPSAPEKRPELDANFAIALDPNYWSQRTGAVHLKWMDHPLFQDARLKELVGGQPVLCKGPQAMVSEPKDAADVAARMTVDGAEQRAMPAVIVRKFGKGRVVYLPSGIDAAMWSYSLPYQRRLLARAIEVAADNRFPIAVQAPMCVQSTFFEQSTKSGSRIIVHLFNGINSTAGHGLPSSEVPLREESIPIHGIKVRFEGMNIKRFHLEPGGVTPAIQRDGNALTVTIPPLDIHTMLVAEKQQ
jgi:hypothetical protein